MNLLVKYEEFALEFIKYYLIGILKKYAWIYFIIYLEFLINLHEIH
jgi:hypothetical protein